MPRAALWPQARPRKKSRLAVAQETQVTYNSAVFTIQLQLLCLLPSTCVRQQMFHICPDTVCIIISHYKSASYTCVVICPIAIAYSYGTDNKISLRVSVCLSVCLSVCPCVITLTVAFLCRFSPNLTERCKPPKVRTSSLGVNIAPPLPLFYP